MLVRCSWYLSAFRWDCRIVEAVGERNTSLLAEGLFEQYKQARFMAITFASEQRVYGNDDRRCAEKYVMLRKDRISNWGFVRSLYDCG